MQNALIRIFATVASRENTNFPAFCSQSSGDEFDERGFSCSARGDVADADHGPGKF